VLYISIIYQKIYLIKKLAFDKQVWIDIFYYIDVL